MLLDGVRVLDLSRLLPGGYCTQLLQAQGAQVTKIEPPAGDPIRALPGGNTYFDALHGGKQLLTLDLRTETGRDALRERVVEADILVEGFRPGVMERMELGYPALAAINREQPNALFVYPDTVTASVRPQTIEFANKQRLPAVYDFKPWAEAGGLLSYGASLPDMSRRAAGQVDKILKGAKPADLPVEQPTKFELVVNLKTAKALGLTVPLPLLGRADEVIE